MKHASSAHLAESSEHGNLQMAMKTAAFLAAIKRGAHFIFHSNPGEAQNVFDRGVQSFESALKNLRFFVILSIREGLKVVVCKQGPLTGFRRISSSSLLFYKRYVLMSPQSY